MLKQLLARRFQATQSVAEKFRFKSLNSTISIKSLIDNIDSESLEKKQYTINGWIDKKAKKVKKDLYQTTIRDANGNLLTMIGSKEQLHGLNLEDCLQITGYLKLRKNTSSAKDTPNDYEVALEDVKVLNKVESKIPSSLTNLNSIEDIPADFSFLKLRKPKYSHIIQSRSKLKNLVRNYLENDLQFVEVETPLLFKSTPEGAKEFLVQFDDTVENKSNLYYALPQSPQQFKQMLMGSGVSKYYQFAKCFRNETLRKDRQPEFTQLDMEIAFGTGKEVMQIAGTIVTKAWNSYAVDAEDTQKLYTLDKQGNSVLVEKEEDILRMDYTEAMKTYGSDKPDLRIPLKIINMKEFGGKGGLNNPVFDSFEVIHLPQSIKTPKELNELKKFLLDSSHYNDGSRKPVVHGILSESDLDLWHEAFANVGIFESPKLITKSLNLKVGDVIIGCDRESDSFIFENPTPMGKARALLYDSNISFLNEYLNMNYPKLDKDIVSWMVNFPLMNPVVDETAKKINGYPNYKPKCIESCHHPFTMCQLDHLPLLQKLLESDDVNYRQALFVKSQHYDLVLNGNEIGGGSTRIHDYNLQSQIFNKFLNIDAKKQEELFGHLLQVFKNGCPPHSGFAIGWDRFLSVLFKTPSIKEVIAFPKSNTGVDELFKSPSLIERK
ncbi:hypothetical protein ACO0OL_002981 [Hanseniaspora opuntiae]